MIRPDASTYYVKLGEAATELSRAVPLPIRLKDICAHLGVVVTPSEAIRSPRHGRLVRSGAAWTILVPSLKNWTTDRLARLRFTIAHELGHILLFKLDRVSIQRPKDYWVVERMCDWFAGRLLIPERAFASTPQVGADDIRADLDLPSALAARTQTSMGVAATEISRRFNSLTYVRFRYSYPASAASGVLTVAFTSLCDSRGVSIGRGAKLAADSELARAVRRMGSDGHSDTIRRPCLGRRVLGDEATVFGRRTASGTWVVIRSKDASSTLVG